MKKKSIANICLSLLAAATVLTVGVNSALAYFTTYTTAEGGIPIHLGDRTEIEESFSNKIKHITITSEAGSEPVYIRARAFCTRYGYSYQSVVDGAWTENPGDNHRIPDADKGQYWYYTSIVKGGESTSTLDVIIDIPSQTDPAVPGQPALEDGDSFNVIVIYESTPVRYDENGNPYADWNEKLDVVTATGSGIVSDSDAGTGDGR